MWDWDTIGIWLWINTYYNTILRGMNIHLPAILMFTRGTRFWHTAICWYFGIFFGGFLINYADIHGYPNSWMFFFMENLTEKDDLVAPDILGKLHNIGIWLIDVDSSWWLRTIIALIFDNLWLKFQGTFFVSNSLWSCLVFSKGGVS